VHFIKIKLLLFKIRFINFETFVILGANAALFDFSSHLAKTLNKLSGMITSMLFVTAK